MTRLHVGCYTSASDVGIHTFTVGAGGALEHVSATSVSQASFLALAPAGDVLYAVRETSDTGAVLALRERSGGLEVLDEVPSLGAGPCHVSAVEDMVYVANYASGDIAAYHVTADGRFGDVTGHHRHHGSGPHPRQDAPHAHCIAPGHDGKFVYAADLGTDRIVRYERDDGEGLRCVGDTALSPGSGPRHLTFHPTLPFAFIVCELDCTLVTAEVDGDTGRLTVRSSVSTLPEGFTRDALAAGVAVHPDGHRVYVSTRGCDTIATFAFDDGDVVPLGSVSSGGRTPRHIALDPSGELLFAANQTSNTVAAFDLADDGTPRPIGVVTEVSEPACIVFEEADR